MWVTYSGMRGAVDKRVLGARTNCSVTAGTNALLAMLFAVLSTGCMRGWKFALQPDPPSCFVIVGTGVDYQWRLAVAQVVGRAQASPLA